VQRHPGDDEQQAGRLGAGRELREHDDPDDRRGGRQQRHEQRVGRAPQPGERELVADVRDGQTTSSIMQSAPVPRRGLSLLD
jgi:hypothetical protein